MLIHFFHLLSLCSFIPLNIDSLPILRKSYLPTPLTYLLYSFLFLIRISHIWEIAKLVWLISLNMVSRSIHILIDDSCIFMQELYSIVCKQCFLTHSSVGGYIIQFQRFTYYEWYCYKHGYAYIPVIWCV